MPMKSSESRAPLEACISKTKIAITSIIFLMQNQIEMGFCKLENYLHFYCLKASDSLKAHIWGKYIETTGGSQYIWNG